jgi:thiol-disulfide isomerase/thioredoxin
MFKAISGLMGSKSNTKGNNSKNVSVRSPEEIEELEKVIHVGPVAFVFVHADWCGHCQTYKPIWEELEGAPGRKANMAMIHHDMVEKSPTLKKANIPGYPSVLKVYPNGKIEQYNGTNAMPNIRDKSTMLNQIISPSLSYAVSQNTKRNLSNISARASKNIVVGATKAPELPVMKGGSLYAALSQALQQAGPAAVLLAASTALPPKRAAVSNTRRTRKATSKKSSRAKSRKN